MPHVVVKLPGKSEQQKIRLAQEITDSGMSALDYGAESVSVAFEEIESLNPGIGAKRCIDPRSRRSGSTRIRNPATPCEKRRNESLV
jgi:phenylpyruvate tautomerase PptA (4-oxalocrotonate tautomerase family)